MFTIKAASPRLLAAVLAISGLAVPIVASAQDIPSYAQVTSANSDETITGRIASINGTFNIAVNDDRGFADNVELYQGTIINPTGLTLESGMPVTIQGYADGSEFVANEIDTPYTLSDAAPAPVYYGPGWWYPGFDYGYGPAFTLGLAFGAGGSWHFDHEPFHGQPWSGPDGRAYGPHPNVRFTEPVRRVVQPPAQSVAPVYRAPIQGYRGSAPVTRQEPVVRQVPVQPYHAPEPAIRETPPQANRAAEPIVRQAPAVERVPTQRAPEQRSDTGRRH